MMSADLNGDGFCDLVVSEPRATVDGVVQAGRLWIIDGPDLTRAREVVARQPQSNEELGWRRGKIADITGNGALDLIVPSPLLDTRGVSNVGRVHVFHGPDFEIDEVFSPPTIEEQEFGYACSVKSEASGSRSLIIGSPRLSLPRGLEDGTVYAFDPASGRLEAAYPPPTGFGDFGNSLLVDDLNGDGTDDVVVSEPLAFLGSTVGTGLVHRLDGATGQWLTPIAPPLAAPVYELFGEELHALTDLDGDGTDDLLLSASGTDVSATPNAGVALLLTGPEFTDVAHLFEPLAPVGSGRYGNVAAVGDLDLDGNPDVVVGDPEQTLSGDFRAYIHFGPNFEVIQVLGKEEAAWGFGRTLVTADTDGDGVDELFVSAAIGDGSGLIFSYDPMTLFSDKSTVSVAQGGTVNFGLDFPSTHAGKPYRAVLGLSGSQPGTVLGKGSYVPLNLDALTVASVALANGPVLPGFTGSLDDNGNAAFALVLRPGVATALAGKTLSVAAVLMEEGPQPFGAGSSALEIDLAR